MEPIRILLVDDHSVFRKGLAALINSRTDMQVVGEAVNGEEALEYTRSLMPDILVMDVKMPGMGGLGATRAIKMEFPYARIVMLTVSEDEGDLFEAIKAGARGYLLKNVTPETLFEFLHAAMRGETPISPAMATKILAEFRGGTAASSQWSEPLLSVREREILHLVGQGLSNKEIAAQLHLTVGTVKNHVHNILEKLQLQNRSQLAIYTLRQAHRSSEQGGARPS